MKTIPIADLKIVNRQRRTFNEDAIEMLARSITQKGLLHPIVLQNDEKTLVAGERRCRAVDSLLELYTSITHDGEAVPEGHIPYVTLRELSIDDLVEAELEENILRENLTWQEEADAIARLHELRVGQIPNRTFKETAEELTGQTATSTAQVKVRDSVLLQEYLSDPEVIKAKTSKEALKIISKKKQQILTNQLAEQFNIESTPHILNCGDFRDFAQFIETGSVDLILTDPPYGIDADSFGDQAGASHGYEDTPEYFREILEAFIVEANRVTKDRAHLYLFCDPRWVEHINQALSKYGWDTWSVPLSGTKETECYLDQTTGLVELTKLLSTQLKGTKEVTAVYPDVISIPGIQAPRYGAEKPVELYENLIRRSCNPGDLVWDAFAGTGPIFPAANRASVRAVGTELIEDKYNFAKLRLKEDC